MDAASLHAEAQARSPLLTPRSEASGEGTDDYDHDAAILSQLEDPDRQAVLAVRQVASQAPDLASVALPDGEEQVEVPPHAQAEDSLLHRPTDTPPGLLTQRS